MAAPDALSEGFPPIEAPGARVLVLGSLPGQASIDAQQYYAHPRNAFWPIMAELTGASGDYEARVRALSDAGVLVWDVLAASVRPGSLDSAIRMDTAVVNDFDALFARQPGIAIVALNGRKAGDMFTRSVRVPPGVRVELLPSTSPAHAAMSLAQKLETWRGIIAPYLQET